MLGVLAAQRFVPHALAHFVPVPQAQLANGLFCWKQHWPQVMALVLVAQFPLTGGTVDVGAGVVTEEAGAVLAAGGGVVDDTELVVPPVFELSSSPLGGAWSVLDGAALEQAIAPIPRVLAEMSNKANKERFTGGLLVRVGATHVPDEWSAGLPRM
jgi:hypothetical protein